MRGARTPAARAARFHSASDEPVVVVDSCGRAATARLVGRECRHRGSGFGGAVAIPHCDEDPHGAERGERGASAAACPRLARNGEPPPSRA